MGVLVKMGEVGAEESYVALNVTPNPSRLNKICINHANECARKWVNWVKQATWLNWVKRELGELVKWLTLAIWVNWVTWVKWVKNIAACDRLQDTDIWIKELSCMGGFTRLTKMAEFCKRDVLSLVTNPSSSNSAAAIKSGIGEMKWK